MSDEDLACRLPTGHPELAELHDRIASQAILKFEMMTGTTHRAQQAIARRLLDGTPLRSEIAADLNMSDHTFQRRLTDEETSFSELIDGARRELAQHYLADPRMTLYEIAYMLGYADQSTFFAPPTDGSANLRTTIAQGCSGDTRAKSKRHDRSDVFGWVRRNAVRCRRFTGRDHL